MKRKAVVVLAIAAMSVFATSCEKLKARDQLNKGVQAFKNAQYPQAVEHFKTAVEYDPDLRHRAFVSGDRLHAAVYSRRRFAGQHADGGGRLRSVSEGSGAGPQERIGRGFNRFAAVQREEVGRGQRSGISN